MEGRALLSEKIDRLNKEIEDMKRSQMEITGLKNSMTKNFRDFNQSILVRAHHDPECSSRRQLVIFF